MTTASVELRPWPLRRWGVTVALIFGVQLGLIFWLGSTAPIHPRPAAPAPTLRLTGQAFAELRALNDPTLFILPHPEGFSGRRGGERLDRSSAPSNGPHQQTTFPWALTGSAPSSTGCSRRAISLRCNFRPRSRPPRRSPTFLRCPFWLANQSCNWRMAWPSGICWRRSN